MTTKVSLFIELAKPVMRMKADGSGYEVYRSGEHRSNLKIGNVSLGFDGHNNFVGGEGCDRECIELSEYTDDPVRLGRASLTGQQDVAEKLLRALAADLDYHVEYIGNAEHADLADKAADWCNANGRDAVADCAEDSHWDDHPDYAVSDWQYDVAVGNTRESYKEWCASEDRVRGKG